MKPLLLLLLLLCTVLSCQQVNETEIEKGLLPPTTSEKKFHRPEVMVELDASWNLAESEQLWTNLKALKPECEPWRPELVKKKRSSENEESLALMILKGAPAVSYDSTTSTVQLRLLSPENIEKQVPGLMNEISQMLDQRANEQLVSSEDSLQEALGINTGISMKFSVGFELVKADLDFFWAKKQVTLSDSIVVDDPEENRSHYEEIHQNLTMHLFVTKVYQSEMYFLNNPSSVRDSIITTHWQHELQSSEKMETVSLHEDQCIPLDVDSLPYHRFWGTWEISKAYESGPFVTHVSFPPYRKHGVYVEGFLNAPALPKKKYLRELEAILKTAKIL